MLLSHQHEGTIVGDGIRSPPGWQVHAPSLPTGPQAGPGSHWPPISALAAQHTPICTQTPTATPWQHLQDLLVDRGLPVSLGRLFLHCCPARRWWEHRFRIHSWSCKPHLHHLPQPSSSSAGPSPFRCSPSLQEDRPGPGSPRPPSPLWVQAHPCCQEHPARASKTRQISGFWSKAPCASGARGKLSSGAEGGAGTSHRPSLQGCQGSPAGQAFHLPRAPPSQGHNKTG